MEPTPPSSPPEMVASIEDPPLTPYYSSLIARIKVHPPYFAVFRLHYLCACGKHTTPGPKTSIQMIRSYDQNYVTEILRARFAVDLGQTLSYGDACTGHIDASYDGLRVMTEDVKVILHDDKISILELGKSHNKKGKEIKIWVDEEEGHEYKRAENVFETPNFCPCDKCIQKKNRELAAEATNQGPPLPTHDDSDISEEDRTHRESRSRSWSLPETERIGENNSPARRVYDSAESSTPHEEEQVDEWEIETVVQEASEDEDQSEERVWTPRAQHVLPLSARRNTTPPTKISRMPSNEDWERAAKRMRMMR